jgi:hypothetical protein
MARQNVGLISFNRGLISPKALARVDLDRTKLSAEVMTNWTPKTQGAMRIRPGTKHLGSSYSDTGATWVEFAAATDDVALLELTNEKMRVWIDDALLGRPLVTTTVSLEDTGWTDASTGGAISTDGTDIIPTMTAATTNRVKITASSQVTEESDNGQNRSAWKAADDILTTRWADTGTGQSPTLPSWWQVNFDTGGGDTGAYRSVLSYSLRAGDDSTSINRMPSKWSLLKSNYDTGTYATDTGKWTLEDTQGSETDWSISEKRNYTPPGADTGTIEATRHWRLYFTEQNGARELRVAEIEMFDAATAQQVKLVGSARILNASSIGALAKARKRVIVDTGDEGLEHSLVVHIERGPIVLRCGSSPSTDDYIRETTLGTGYHNLAFTPTGSFFVTVQTDEIVDRIIGSMEIGDSGTVEVTTHVDVSSLDAVRYDQSADVVFVDAAGAHPGKIERRGTGRSWSFVKYLPTDGPFQPAASSSARLAIDAKYGNATLRSDIPFFRSGHVGALFRVFNSGQSGVWPLGAQDAATDAIEVTGVSDTGTPSADSERRVLISVAGTYTGTLTIERSFDGPDFGFHAVTTDFISSAAANTDTGTFTRTIYDRDDNVKAYYRVRMSDYTSGVALVTVTHANGGVNGIARVTEYNSTTSADVEILRRFSDTGGSDSWQEASWSDERGYPTAVAIHGGRLGHAAGANLYMSVSDDYESFDDEFEGDAGPIIRTLGAGPVDNIYYIVSLLRLVIGTSGAELSVRSTSIDEPLTPDNSSVRAFSTQGSADTRAVKMDSRAIYVQRSGSRVFMIGFGNGSDGFGDYESSELSLLVPDLLSAGVVSVAIQRQPDTRIHCVLANGTVAVLTYEPQEEVICWSMWETDGFVEKAMVLPGENEDQVYYHVRRTIANATKRYLEKLAMESESEGDTGLSWIADCAKSFEDTGGATVLTGFSHLEGENVVVWADDTGQPSVGKDLSPDVAGAQTTYTVSSFGNITLNETVRKAVAGLPYTADYKSTKLAYAAEFGTALTQVKSVNKIGFVLYNTHNNGLFFGNDTGNLDPLPRVNDAGAQVDANKIFETYDEAAMPFPGLWKADSRIHLRGKAPRPVTVLAGVPNVATNEKT